MARETNMSKEQAFNILNDDYINIDKYYPFELFETIGGKPCSKNITPIWNDKRCDNREIYEGIINDTAEWLNKYRDLYKQDRLDISDMAICHSSDYNTSFTIMINNGLNGMTQMSSQSFKHIVDIAQHLESFYGARVYISATHNHSDCYYYVLGVVIWNRALKEIENRDFANLKPFYHADKNGGL